MSEGDVHYQLLLETLRKIETGVGKLDTDIDEVKKRLAKGDTELALTSLRLDRIEKEQCSIKSRLDQAQHEEQRQTVEIARRRSSRTWDIVRIIIAMAASAVVALLWSGAKAEAQRAARQHVEADK